MRVRDLGITCHTCRSYNQVDRHCLVGKANPQRKLDAISLAETLGPNSLCLHNRYREPLLLRMHRPKERFVWPAPLVRSLRVEVDVEIIEDE